MHEGWRMEDGGWRMEEGGWRMEDETAACVGRCDNILKTNIRYQTNFN
jgi:hypothetical protein